LVNRVVNDNDCYLLSQMAFVIFWEKFPKLLLAMRMLTS